MTCAADAPTLAALLATLALPTPCAAWLTRFADFDTAPVAFDVALPSFATPRPMERPTCLASPSLVPSLFSMLRLPLNQSTVSPPHDLRSCTAPTPPPIAPNHPAPWSIACEPVCNWSLLNRLDPP